MTTPGPSTIASVSPVNTNIKQPQQIWNGGSGIQPFIFNNDEFNTLYIGSQADVLRQDTTSTIPIPPLSGQAWPDANIYAFAPIAVNVLIIPGGSNVQPGPVQVAVALAAAGLATATNQTTQIGHESNIDSSTFAAQDFLGGTVPSALIANAGLTNPQETAALIASGSASGTPGGTPLLHGYNQVTSSFIQTVVIPAGGSSFPSWAIKKPGYIIQIGGVANAASTLPFIEVEMEWNDNVAPTKLAQENWYIACPSSGTNVIFGKGPTKGNQLTLGIKNLDTVNSITVTYSVSETTQHIPRDDWRSFGNPASIPGHALPTGFAGDPPAGLLTEDQYTGTGNSTITRMLPLYCGQVDLAIAVATGFTSLSVAISDLVGNAVIDTRNALATTAPLVISLPRRQCMMTFTAAAAGAWALSHTMTYLEYAS